VISKIQDKVAVITGGNSGIGLATTKVFVRDGAKVALFGRDADTLDAAIVELGGAAIGVRGDVTQLEDLDRLFSTVEQQLGKIDVLFVNAGVAQVRPIDAIDEDRSRVTFEMSFEPKYGPLGWLMGATVMQTQFRKTLSSVLAGLETHALTGEVVSRRDTIAAAA